MTGTTGPMDKISAGSLFQFLVCDIILDPLSKDKLEYRNSKYETISKSE
jgi:hypothetical protein